MLPQSWVNPGNCEQCYLWKGKKSDWRRLMSNTHYHSMYVVVWKFPRRGSIFLCHKIGFSAMQRASAHNFYKLLWSCYMMDASDMTRWSVYLSRLKIARPPPTSKIFWQLPSRADRYHVLGGRYRYWNFLLMRPIIDTDNSERPLTRPIPIMPICP